MSIDISFSDEIKQMTTALEEARAELEELQKQREDYKVDAAELRDAISALRSAAIDERLKDHRLQPRDSSVAAVNLTKVWKHSSGVPFAHHLGFLQLSTDHHEDCNLVGVEVYLTVDKHTCPDA